MTPTTCSSVQALSEGNNCNDRFRTGPQLSVMFNSGCSGQNRLKRLGRRPEGVRRQ
jgi:hypothetical protein